MWRACASSLLWMSLLGAVLSAQHGYTVEDIASGGTLYQSTCAGCHGPDGNLVNGVNLGSGQFRRATTDDELVRIIIGGIPGTSMSGNTFSDKEAGMIVAYLRTMKTGKAVAAGDAGRGRLLFEGKGQCQTCHGSGGPGSRLAPVLSEVAGVRRPADIERAILDPSSEWSPDFRFVRAVASDGTTITGRLLNQDTWSIQVLDSRESLRSFEKAGLREYAMVTTSPMPAYRGVLSSQEVADLVAYVRSLGSAK